MGSNVKDKKEDNKLKKEEINEQTEEEKLKEENISLKDKLMRALAEAENTRKRYEKQLIEKADYAINKFSKDILEIADNLERNSQNMKEKCKDKIDSNSEVFLKGLSMTQENMFKVLEKYKIKEITENKEFDSTVHEAIMTVNVKEKDNNEIVEVVRKGYKMGDKLLRPAQVIVNNKE